MRLLCTVGDKNHRWRNSIDVFDSGIWANIDQLLTAAPFPLFFSTALQSTGYNCTHREEDNAKHSDNSKGRVPSKHANTNRRYQAAAAYMRVCNEENESSVSTAVTAAALLFPLRYHHQWFTSTSPSTKPSQGRWRYSRHTVLQIKRFLSGWLKAHTQCLLLGSSWNPSPVCQPHRTQRKAELPRDKHAFHITIHVCILQVNTVHREGNIM